MATAAGFVGGDGGREFRTGDLGRWVDGRLEVLGRVDDVVVTGGEKVAPAAVERVLAAQPGVRAACVVALPDPEWGAVVAAALVVEGAPAAGAPAVDDLRAAVRAALGRAAVPQGDADRRRPAAARDREAGPGRRSCICSGRRRSTRLN